MTATEPTAPAESAPLLGEDYEQTYADVWRDLVEADGVLDRDKVARELHDYSVVMQEVSRAYCEITGGRISKPNTAAHHVIGEVTEYIEQAVREEIAREVAPTAPATPLLGEAAYEMLLDRFAELLWLQDVGTKGKARTLATELYRAFVEPLVAERECLARIDERLKCAAACDRLGAPDVASIIRDSAA